MTTCSVFCIIESQVSDLVSNQHSVEIRESGKTEEDIDNICSEINALLPVISQHSSQSKEEGT